MEATPHHTHFKKQTLVNQLSNPKQPEWIRLPRAGERCPYSNLSRSTLNNLILPCKANKNRPPVKSSVVRQKGATRGVRLIHRASLMAYIEAGKETAFGQNANISSNGSLRSLKERLSAITGVQNFSIGGNEKAKMGSLISFKAPGDGVHGWIMRAALKAKRADCSVKLLDRWPLATSKAYCLSENQYAQANHLRDKLFHQKQSTSNEAPVGVNGQKATKKDSNSDRPPHAPILMNSTPLITIDRDDDPHHSTVNAAHDLVRFHSF